MSELSRGVFTEMTDLMMEDLLGSFHSSPVELNKFNGPQNRKPDRLPTSMFQGSIF